MRYVGKKPGFCEKPGFWKRSLALKHEIVSFQGGGIV